MCYDAGVLASGTPHARPKHGFDSKSRDAKGGRKRARHAQGKRASAGSPGEQPGTGCRLATHESNPARSQQKRNTRAGFARANGSAAGQVIEELSRLVDAGRFRNTFWSIGGRRSSGDGLAGRPRIYEPSSAPLTKCGPPPHPPCTFTTLLRYANSHLLI